MLRALLCALCIFVFCGAAGNEPAFAVSKAAFQKAKVKGVAVRSVDYDTVKVSWKKSAGANGYIIYASKYKLAKYYKVARVSSSRKLDINIDQCETGKKYYFKVQAYKGTGSARIYGKVSSPVAGKAVLTKPYMTAGAVGGKVALIQWDACSDAGGYEIWRANGTAGKFKKIKTAGKSVTKYSDTGRKLSATYKYKIRTYRKVNGKKIYSNYSKVRTLVMPSRDGNAAEYDVSNLTAAEDSLLKGKNLIFLGSSVTYGKYSDGQSFVDILQKVDGVNVTKSAKNGTTLVDQGANSYIKRLKGEGKESNISQSLTPDYLVCQLSTNDARTLQKLGKQTANPSREDYEGFDTSTVSGAIQYITGYTEERFDCPVVFYVVPQFESTYFNDGHYAKMREKLYAVKKAWDGHDRLSDGSADNRPGDQILILDMWEHPKFAYASKDERRFNMVDSVHPTKAGYLERYVPCVREFLEMLYSEAWLNPGASEEGTEGTDGTEVTEGADGADGADPGAMDGTDGAGGAEPGAGDGAGGTDGTDPGSMDGTDGADGAEPGAGGGAGGASGAQPGQAEFIVLDEAGESYGAARSGV